MDLLAHTTKMRPVPTLYEHFFRPRHDRQFRHIYDYMLDYYPRRNESEWDLSYEIEGK